MPLKREPAAYAEHEAMHPIQVVARRTGLSADVIRAWERRYHAVTPERSPTQRRLYSDADVQRLRLLGQAISAGRRIGDVAHLPLAELVELIGADQAAVGQTLPAVDAADKPHLETVSEGDTHLAHVEACLEAIKQLHPAALETALNRAAVACSLPLLLEGVIERTMTAVGRGWQEGSLRLAHEHMTTAVIRSFLGARVSAYEGTTAEFAPVLVVTTPEGQRHELGALMSALIAAAKGWQPLYLGPSTPTDEIAFAAVHTAARAVALSIGYPADDPRLPSALQTLRQQLPTEVALLAGGASVQHYQAALRAIGAVCPKDLQDLQTELDRLRQPQQQALSS